MARSFKQLSRKCLALSLALVMVLTLFLTGCSPEVILQELARDFVQINVSHTLISESKENEPLNTFEIKAVVTNNYLVDLVDAAVTLTVPNSVTITEGKSTVRRSISCSNNNVQTFTWKVETKPTHQDQNIEYSVSLASALISTVTAYESLFVDGLNTNDNRMDFSQDTWKFANYTVDTIPLTQADYEALILDLDSTDRTMIRNKINNGAGGQCYGMAITSIMAKVDRLDPSTLQKGASNLHDVKKKNGQSVIGYYYLTQFLSPAREKITEYINKTEASKLSELATLAENVESGGTPVLLCFYTLSGGHAVVAYGRETCNETYNGTTFTNRILLYDNNFPNNYLYLYYNASNQWEILYKGFNGSWNKPYSTDILGFITSSMELIDISNIDQNKKSVYSYITSRDNAYLEITANGTTWQVNGTSTSDPNKVIAYYDIGDAVSSNLNIAIVKDETEVAYSVKSTDSSKALDISIDYDNFFIAAETNGSGQVNLAPEGSVEITGETTDFNLSITASDDHTPFTWSTVQIDGQSGKNPKLEITSDGYLLSGEDLKKVEIYAENADKASKLTLKTDEDTVLLCEEGDNLCVKADTNDDGQYETVLVTGKNIDPIDPAGSSHQINWGLWAIIIGGSVLVIAAVVTIIILLSKRRRPPQNPGRPGAPRAPGNPGHYGGTGNSGRSNPFA